MLLYQSYFHIIYSFKRLLSKEHEIIKILLSHKTNAFYLINIIICLQLRFISIRYFIVVNITCLFVLQEFPITFSTETQSNFNETQIV